MTVARVLIGTIIHEANSFSPVQTPLKRFGVRPNRGLLTSEQLLRYTGTDTEIAGLLEVFGSENIVVDVVEPADALPSGPIALVLVDELVVPIVRQVHQGDYDAIVLILHGAMASGEESDVDGLITDKVREAADQCPIFATFDMHANLSARTAANLVAACGYRTYPHVDCAETGRRLGRLVVRTLAREIEPTIFHVRVPILAPIMSQATTAGPNKSLQALANDTEANGVVLAASVFTGFPHADTPQTGMSVIVVGDRRSNIAQMAAHRLASAVWDMRDEFHFHPELLSDSIARIEACVAAGETPVVALDHRDNCGSGGTMTSTTVLSELLSAHTGRTLFYGVHDPEAVQKCLVAGRGSEINLDVGGEESADLVGGNSPRLRLRGRVRTLSDGKFLRRGPFAAGTVADVGPVAVFDVGDTSVVLLSQHTEPADIALLIGLDFDPHDFDTLCFKSRVHWQAGFAGLAKAVIPCDGTGVCVSDYASLPYKLLRRPIFPLDKGSDFEAGVSIHLANWFDRPQTGAEIDGLLP
jgi:microcystin degradation protein MlrC